MVGGRGFLLEGFYKVRFQVDDAVGRSVMYANGGSMLGGNSAFAHYGTYSEVDGVVTSEITSHRHNDDPNYQSLLGSDIATIDVRGSAIGDIYHFEGGSPQMPGAVFRSVMTPIADEIVAPSGCGRRGRYRQRALFRSHQDARRRRWRPDRRDAAA